MATAKRKPSSAKRPASKPRCDPALTADLRARLEDIEDDLRAEKRLTRYLTELDRRNDGSAATARPQEYVFGSACDTPARAAWPGPSAEDLRLAAFFFFGMVIGFAFAVGFVKLFG